MATWPDEAEFRQFLVASGLHAFSNATEAQNALDLSGALTAGVERWNELTHYWPFLSTGDATEERRFDPRMGRIIDLNGGLLTLTSLSTGVTYGSTGNARVSVRDFRLMPTDAAPRKKPYTYIECLQFYPLSDSAEAGSIKVVGEWGYCTAANLPESARRAVMALAAQELTPQIAMVLSRGGLTQLTEGDSTKRWGGMADLAAGWQSTVTTALAQGYVRPRIA